MGRRDELCAGGVLNSSVVRCLQLAVFLFTLAIGLDLAVAWGVISFVLNYIPYLGPLIAVILPVIFSTAQFESWQMAAIIFGSLYVIQFVIGSYLEPVLTGTALAISPFVMLLAFLIWDFCGVCPGLSSACL
jgi:AI-2 transport protein TqsA